MTLPSNVKTIFFDVKNVILYFHPQKMLSQIAEYCGIEQSMIQEMITKENWQEKYERGEIDSRTLFHYLPEKIREDRGFARFGEAISNVFDANASLGPMIKQLKQSNIKLYILSNICEIHFSYAYTHFSAFHLFDDYLLSYEMGAKKPEQKLFDQALKKTNTSPKEALFIEGLEEYTEKARAYGLDSEFYQSPDLLKQQLISRGCLIQ